MAKSKAPTKASETATTTTTTIILPMTFKQFLIKNKIQKQYGSEKRHNKNKNNNISSL